MDFMYAERGGVFAELLITGLRLQWLLSTSVHLTSAQCQLLNPLPLSDPTSSSCPPTYHIASVRHLSSRSARTWVSSYFTYVPLALYLDNFLYFFIKIQSPKLHFYDFQFVLWRIQWKSCCITWEPQLSKRSLGQLQCKEGCGVQTMVTRNWTASSIECKTWITYWKTRHRVLAHKWLWLTTNQTLKYSVTGS